MGRPWLIIEKPTQAKGAAVRAAHRDDKGWPVAASSIEALVYGQLFAGLTGVASQIFFRWRNVLLGGQCDALFRVVLGIDGDVDLLVACRRFYLQSQFASWCIQRNTDDGNLFSFFGWQRLYGVTFQGKTSTFRKGGETKQSNSPGHTAFLRERPN